jgi:hypothetical protein
MRPCYTRNVKHAEMCFVKRILIYPIYILKTYFFSLLEYNTQFYFERFEHGFRIAATPVYLRESVESNQYAKTSCDVSRFIKELYKHKNVCPHCDYIYI